MENQKNLFDARFDALCYDLIRTYFGRELVVPRYNEPEAQQEIILEKLNLELPRQAPTRFHPET